ncbi:MAG TPA: flagellar biosynthesis anti-sigma factor FlgM [Actinobacteria bacterium]|nr:flagellar biosynthesis anti-sigma factor FlgM [Actinomycetota bacterium]
MILTSDFSKSRNKSRESSSKNTDRHYLATLKKEISSGGYRVHSRNVAEKMLWCSDFYLNIAEKNYASFIRVPF